MISSSADKNTHTVFFIDFGNTAQVNLSEMLEISADLVDQIPKSYAINCRLRITNAAIGIRKNKLNEFFYKIFETNKFLVKCLERRKEMKFHDSYVYEVELFDSQSEENVLEIFDREHPQEFMDQSCMQLTNFASVTTTYLSNSGDDRAIADEPKAADFNDTININGDYTQTNKADKTDSWNETNASKKNYDPIPEDSVMNALDATNISIAQNSTLCRTNVANYSEYVINRSANVWNVAAISSADGIDQVTDFNEKTANMVTDKCKEVTIHDYPNRETYQKQHDLENDLYITANDELVFNDNNPNEPIVQDDEKY